MPVEAVRHYKADDGKLYPTYEAAQAAQTKWRIVQELLMKPELATEFRDALNLVVDYHRHRKE